MTETNCRIGKVKPKGNLVLLPQPNDPDRITPCNDVLRGAINQLGYVIVIGRELETDKIYFAASDGNIANVMMLMDKTKHKILRGDYGAGE